MKEKIWNFIKEEDGLELSEYALMGALIVIALILAVQGLSGAIADVFSRMSSTISGAGS